MFCNALTVLSLKVCAGLEKTTTAMPLSVRKQISQYIIGRWAHTTTTWGGQVMEGMRDSLMDQRQGRSYFAGLSGR